MDAVGNANALGAAWPFSCDDRGGSLEQERTPKEKNRSQHRPRMGTGPLEIKASSVSLNMLLDFAGGVERIPSRLGSDHLEIPKLFLCAVAIDRSATTFPALGYDVEMPR